VWIQLLRGGAVIALVFLLSRYLWLGLARRYRFFCTYAAVQLTVTISFAYFFDLRSQAYAVAWVLSRWIIIALQIAAAAEVYWMIAYAPRGTRWLPLVVMLPVAALGSGGLMVVQGYAITPDSGFLRILQITCLVYSSLSFAVVIGLLLLAVFLILDAQRHNTVVYWLGLMTYFTIQGLTFFLQYIVALKWELLYAAFLPANAVVLLLWGLLTTSAGERPPPAVRRHTPFADKIRKNGVVRRFKLEWERAAI